MSDRLCLNPRMTRNDNHPYRSERWLSPKQIQARFDRLRRLICAIGVPPVPVQSEFGFFAHANLTARRRPPRRPELDRRRLSSAQ